MLVVSFFGTSFSEKEALSLVLLFTCSYLKQQSVNNWNIIVCCNAVGVETYVGDRGMEGRIS